MKRAADEDVFAPLQPIVSMRLPMRHILVYAGSLPFYMVAIALSLPNTFSVVFFDPVQFLKIYSAVILSFVAGAQWGFSNRNANSIDSGFLLATNIVTLLTVVMVISLPDVFAILVSIVLLFVLLLMDSMLLKKHAITKHYFGLRRTITFVVGAALSWSLIALLFHN